MAANTKHTRWDAGGMDLEQTLFCGQSFSWERTGDGWYHGVAGNRTADVRLEDGALLLQLPEGAADEDLAFWRRYFALDVDYAALHTAYRRCAQLGECLNCAPGLRLLRQPFFDTLLSFIISQNNHIPRITGIVARLREEFGPALPGGHHGFPSPETLAALTPEDLAPLRAGFRAKYLVDAARKVAEGTVSETAMKGMEDAGARAHLKQITGVGDKVADCVLLFALGRSGVAPMDVWMKRAMRQAFPGGMPPEAAGTEGIAQQYIFWWARQHLEAGS